jgi:uncharacterized membrane protein YedE/YeeE
MALPSEAAVKFLLAGIAFGFVLTRAEVISWFRIQEMFRFQSFHMYGIIGTAILVAAVSLEILKRIGARAWDGTPIALAPKQLGRGYRYAIGGTIFGVGWAFTGACPGPLFALLGSGISVMVLPIFSALAGTWAYAWLRPHLPH